MGLDVKYLNVCMNQIPSSLKPTKGTKSTQGTAEPKEIWTPDMLFAIIELCGELEYNQWLPKERGFWNSVWDKYTTKNKVPDAHAKGNFAAACAKYMKKELGHEKTPFRNLISALLFKLMDAKNRQRRPVNSAIKKKRLGVDLYNAYQYLKQQDDHFKYRIRLPREQVNEIYVGAVSDTDPASLSYDLSDIEPEDPGILDPPLNEPRVPVSSIGRTSFSDRITSSKILIDNLENELSLTQEKERSLLKKITEEKNNLRKLKSQKRQEDENIEFVQTARQLIPNPKEFAAKKEMLLALLRIASTMTKEELSEKFPDVDFEHTEDLVKQVPQADPDIEAESEDDEIADYMQKDSDAEYSGEESDRSEDPVIISSKFGSNKIGIKRVIEIDSEEERSDEESGRIPLSKASEGGQERVVVGDNASEPNDVGLSRATDTAISGTDEIERATEPLQNTGTEKSLLGTGSKEATSARANAGIQGSSMPLVAIVDGENRTLDHATVIGNQAIPGEDPIDPCTPMDAGESSELSDLQFTKKAKPTENSTRFVATKNKPCDNVVESVQGTAKGDDAERSEAHGAAKICAAGKDLAVAPTKKTTISVSVVGGKATNPLTPVRQSPRGKHQIQHSVEREPPVKINKPSSSRKATTAKTPAEPKKKSKTKSHKKALTILDAVANIQTDGE